MNYPESMIESSLSVASGEVNLQISLPLPSLGCKSSCTYFHIKWPVDKIKRIDPVPSLKPAAGNKSAFPAASVIRLSSTSEVFSYVFDSAYNNDLLLFS